MVDRDKNNSIEDDLNDLKQLMEPKMTLLKMIRITKRKANLIINKRVYFTKQLTRKPTVKSKHLHIPMEKEILKNLLVIFGQRKTKKQNLFYQEVICYLQLDVKLHVTLFTAVRVAYYLTQMQKMLYHLMIICTYL